MTGKRFEIERDSKGLANVSYYLKDNLGELMDNYGDMIYWRDGTTNGLKQIVELLNELYEENQALKSDRAKEYRFDVFKEFYEKNEQLKKELDYWKKKALLLERKEMCKQYNEIIR